MTNLSFWHWILLLQPDYLHDIIYYTLLLIFIRFERNISPTFGKEFSASRDLDFCLRESWILLQLSGALTPTLNLLLSHKYDSRSYSQLGTVFTVHILIVNYRVQLLFVIWLLIACLFSVTHSFHDWSYFWNIFLFVYLAQ